MLAPTKHTNIKHSVIYIAGKLLSYLNDETVLKYDELKSLLTGESGMKSKYNFDFALTFLFSIGKIKYLKDIDAIMLTGGKDEA